MKNFILPLLVSVLVIMTFTVAVAQTPQPYYTGTVSMPGQPTQYVSSAVPPGYHLVPDVPQRGSRGPQGLQGPKGDTGAVGPMGPQGQPSKFLWTYYLFGLLVGLLLLLSLIWALWHPWALRPVVTPALDPATAAMMAHYANLANLGHQAYLAHLDGGHGHGCTCGGRVDTIQHRFSGEAHMHIWLHEVPPTKGKGPEKPAPDAGPKA